MRKVINNQSKTLLHHRYMSHGKLLVLLPSQNKEELGNDTREEK